MRRPLFWTALGELLPRLIGFAITLFIARSLGPRGFGVFSLAYSWVHFCWGAVDLGTGNYAIRVLAEDRATRDKNLSELFILNGFLAVSMLALAAGAAMLLIRDPTLMLTTLFMLPFLPTFAAFPDWYLRGTGALQQLALCNFAVAGLWLAGTIVLQRLPQPEGFGLAWALSPVGGSLVFWLRARNKRINLREGLRPRAWLSHLRVSAVFALSGAISNATIPLMLSVFGLYAGLGVLGSYTLGLRLAMMGGGALWLVLQNLTPQLVERRAEVRPIRVIGGTLVIGILGLGALTVAFPYVLVPILGQSYGTDHLWTLLGAAAIIPWTTKLPIEALLIANRLDWVRVSVQTVSLIGVLLAGASLWLFSAPIILPAGYLVAESAGAALGWILLERYRRYVAGATGTPTPLA